MGYRRRVSNFLWMITGLLLLHFSAASDGKQELVDLDIIVSPHGKNLAGCGKSGNPCRTIIHAASIAKANAVIKIDGSYGRSNTRSDSISSSTETQYSLNVNKNLTFIGINGKPLLTAADFNSTFAFHLPYSASTNGSLELRIVNLELHMPVIQFQGGRVHIENCIINGTRDFNASAIGVYYEGVASNPISLTIVRSTFLNCNSVVDFQDFTRVDFKFIESQITTEEKTNGDGISFILDEVGIAPHHRQLRITVSDSAFTGLRSALRVKNYAHTTGVVIQLKNSIFSDIHNKIGGGAIDLQSDGKYLMKVSIDGCQFLRNAGAHGGAAYLHRVNVRISGSIFNSNYARFSGGALMASDTLVIPVENTIFLNNSVDMIPKDIAHFKASESTAFYDGSGGAVVLLGRSHGIFINCTWKENQAYYGGALANNGLMAEITNSSFTGPPESHSVLGDLIYSIRCLYLSNVNMTAQENDAKATLIYHHALYVADTYPAMFFYDSLRIKCAPGGNITDHSAPIDTMCKWAPYGSNLRKFRCFHQFVRSCVPCPWEKYNLFSSYSFGNGDTDQLRKTECYPCPYGGKCTNKKVAARPGFWGYHSGAKAVFIRCPKGYCCENDMCKGINHCAPNREGTFCGRCKRGYTETMTSPMCISNSQCSFILFWLMVSIGAFLFVVIMLTLNKLQHLFCLLLWKYPLMSACKRIVADWHKSMEEYKVKNSKERSERIKNDLRSPLLLENSGKMDAKDLPEQGSEVQSSESVADTLSSKQTAMPEPWDTATKDSTERQNYFFSGLVKILFFFFQVQVVFRFRDCNMQKGYWDIIKDEFSSFFNFEVVQDRFGMSLCIFPDIKPTTKYFMKPLFIFFMMVFATLMYIIRTTISWVTKEKSKFPIRYWKGRFAFCFLQILLLGYSSITIAVLTPLRCVTVKGKWVMFFDGTVSCVSPQRYVFIAVLVSFVVPFVFAPTVLASYLRKKRITRREFVAGLLLPAALVPFFIVRWFLRQRSSNPQDKEGKIKESITKCSNQIQLEKRAVRVEEDEFLTGEICAIIEGPFRSHSSGYGFLYWESVLIGGRLCFIFPTFLTLEYIDQNSLILVVACVMLILHHVALPFKNNMLNFVQGLMLLKLCILGILNSFPIYFFSSGVHPIGIMETIGNHYRKAETVILLTMPVLILFILLLLVAVRCLVAVLCGFYLGFHFVRNQWKCRGACACAPPMEVCT